MARLSEGESEKIDKINRLVFNTQNGIDVDNSVTELLKMFRPLILSLCNKWSTYFNDTKHNIKRFDELICDSEYWFVHYTMYKYTIDGVATFNTFIKNHLDQRIRYMYEQELKYYKKLIFPDPDKRTDDDLSAFENVVHTYSSNNDNGFEEDVINNDEQENRSLLAHKVISIIEEGYCFNDREKQIFIEIICNGVTHDKMGETLNVSRTRISQILRKTKVKLYNLMIENQEIWDMVTSLGIEFKEL